MKRAFLSVAAVALLFVSSSAASTLIKAEGWTETFYLTWNKVPAATGYTVEYQRGGAGAWVAIDQQLIRDYGGYMRADVLGIGAGTYNARIVSGNTTINATNITVAAHERTGFAFMNNVVPGAYKADGTLKDGAVIIYINDQNKNNITATVKTSASGTETLTGIQPIIKGFEKGYEDRPFAFRFIGRVTNENITAALDGGDINIKGSSNASRTFPHITIEGVGNDATLYGFAIKTSRAKYLEIRNLGFMLTKSTEGDNVGINTSSEYIWVHHNDMFYGSAGGDADQAKGDGATDAKASTYITISYNRYWDSGKTHLFGNSESETPGYITIHHNWYDHSDSRHPRVRKHYVHVYNNYYNYVSTYGIGAVMASSIFAERNYFNQTNRPMTISMQGSDASSKTFSSEAGGMIKAFENFMDAESKKTYTPHSGSNTVEFDAYEVTNATATVPSSVTAKSGGSTFNNNMMANYPTYTTQNDSASVRKKVTSDVGHAGRYWGGDFTFNIPNARTSNIVTELMTALRNYKGYDGVGVYVPPSVVVDPPDIPDPDCEEGKYCEGNADIGKYCVVGAACTQIAAGQPVCLGNVLFECPSEDQPSLVKSAEIGDGELIENVVVYDTSLASAQIWRIESGFGADMDAYPNREHRIVSVSAALQGSEWLSPSFLTRVVPVATADVIVTFTMKKAGVVSVIYDNRVAENPALKPAWLAAAGFEASGQTVTVNDRSSDSDRPFTVYSKAFAAGETVSLGANSETGTTTSMMYLVAVTDSSAVSAVNRARPARYSLKVSRAGGGAFKISYALRAHDIVRLELYDIKGNRVRTLVNASRGAGVHRERFEAKGLAAGMYLVKLRAGGTVLQQRLTITR